MLVLLAIAVVLNFLRKPYPVSVGFRFYQPSPDYFLQRGNAQRMTGLMSYLLFLILDGCLQTFSWRLQVLAMFLSRKFVPVILDGWGKAPTGGPKRVQLSLLCMQSGLQHLDAEACVVKLVVQTLLQSSCFT